MNCFTRSVRCRKEASKLQVILQKALAGLLAMKGSERVIQLIVGAAGSARELEITGGVEAAQVEAVRQGGSDEWLRG